MNFITHLRKANPNDCEEIYQSHLFAVQYACKNCYDDTILKAWSELLSPNSYLESFESKELWVIEYKNNIQGFFQLDLHNAELDALYVHPFVHGLGLGTALLQKAEEIANQADLTFLKLYASLNSVLFYELNHYQRLRECKIMLNPKIYVECQLMKKNLLHYD